jgi:uncharacterized repeat protein (TIGR01451 family)
LTDLVVTKTSAPATVTLGGNLTYTLSVSNKGPNTATGVTLADALPAGVTFVSVATSQGTCSFAAGAVNCALGTLPVGPVVTITIVVRPTTAGPLLNTVVTAGNEPEANPADNRAQAPNTVVAPFTPPVVAPCPTLTVTPGSASIGKRTVVVARVTLQNRPVRGVRIAVRGPGINTSGTTAANGIVRLGIQPRRAGILTIRMTNQPVRCNTARIGLVGVFKPPVTG